MKKVKLNISGAGIKNFFIQHGEKIVVGLSVICLGMFVFKAIGRETLPANKGPQELTKVSNNAKAAWEAAPPKQPTPPPDLNGQLATKVPDLTLKNPWNPLVFPPKEKRQDPVMFPVEDLRTNANRGPIALAAKGPANTPVAPPPVEKKPKGGKSTVAPPPGGLLAPSTSIAPAIGGGNAPVLARAGVDPHNGPVEARHWIVVTGAVPFGKQMREYQERLKIPAIGKGNDLPQYVYAYVYRAEVPSDTAAVADKDWKLINPPSPRPTAFEADHKKWHKDAPDIVAKEYLADPVSMVTSPLPPLLLRDWTSDEVAHPKVELEKVEQARVAAPSEVAPGPVKPGVTPDDTFGGPTEKEKDKEPEKKKPVYGQAPDSMTRIAEKGPVNYQLFRYFDFTAQPGKTYRYRVQLVLRDPNFGEPDQNLEKPNPSIKKFREAPMSEASTAATVPPDINVLATGARVLGNSLSKDTTYELAILVYDVKEAIEAIEKFDMPLGAIANFNGGFKHLEPGTSQSKDYVDFPFYSNCVLIDARGGDRLSRDAKEKDALTEPLELLFVDDKGNLLVRNSADDVETIEEATEKTSPPTAAAAVNPVGVYGVVPPPAGDPPPAKKKPVPKTPRR